jgi:pimeloyl-ACP methyl ester carboxylesterase
MSATLAFRSLAALLLISALGLGACAPHRVYRGELSACSPPDPEQSCGAHSVERFDDPANPAGTYTLGFVEFDDQGELWSREQMETVVGAAAEASALQDQLLVVFVHGWKHSAAVGDGNIQTFRDVLKGLSELESGLAKNVGRPRRGVFGVYVGWRGASITFPVIQELTFWDRKNTAHKVGYGGVTELFSRLEQIKRTRDAIEGGRDLSNTRLVVIGHSFGGAVVYSALSQLLADRFVLTVGPEGQSSDIEGFGDLVVMINPAFEAMRFATPSDMANERRTYFPTQLPVLAILTSSADQATGTAFPVGRWFSTFWEKHRVVQRPDPVTGATEDIDQEKANITSVGHFAPYWTHQLTATAPPVEHEAGGMGTARELDRYATVSREWEQDKPGNAIDFEGSRLLRSENSVGRNPYLVIRVEGELIPNHNDITDPRIVSFIRQLIQLSVQDANLKVRAEVREQMQK